MLIVIEGADKTGKTTLAKAVAKVHKLKYFHFGPPGPDSMKEYAKLLLSLKEPAICDRFFLGELVYGPMLRGKDPDWMDVLTIVRLSRRLGVQHILLEASHDVMKSRFDADKEAVTWVQNLKAAQAFKMIFDAYPVGRKTIMRGDTNDQLLENIDRCGKMYRELKVHHDLYRKFSGIGSVKGPSFVLVGEKVNQSTTRFGLPFDGGPSARFLNSCLVDLPEPVEKHLYLTNVDTLHPDELRHHDVTGSTFVALGAKATRALKPHVKNLVSMAHPQYWSRFKTKQKDLYVNQLRQAFQKFMREAPIWK